MGGVAVLHPRDCLKDHPDNLVLTAMKSSRIINFSPITTSDSRKRTPQKGILKKKDRNTDDPPAATASKCLAMGQVRILKRGEALNESSTISDDTDDRKVSNGAASTPPEALVSAREAFKAPMSGRRASPTKKKGKKYKKMASPKVEVSHAEDVALSSTDRLGPDPETVSKQMKKNKTEFFAGYAFADSPPPSSVPLPGFFTKNFTVAVRDDATNNLRRILGLNVC